ncbi:MAG: ubiB [Alphaproteobacteria bacterium]|nr:ubiB [Alphaproteobacteria bacterium]
MPRVPTYGAAFQDIGPAAIKLGQALATRPDLVGPEAARDLLLLQDNLPPAPFEQIKLAIEKGLERPIEQVFAEIDPEPVGAASIAQVHRARTTDGKLVAVKVLRPNIEEDFAKALDTYEWAATQVESMGGEAARLRPRLVIAHFRQWTARELDLRREAASASELRQNMVAESGFHVPEIDWSRTSRRVMTLEWIDGIKLTDRDALVAAGHDLPALAATLVRAFLRQAVVDGFFHADLHQGNLFALPDGRLAAIDFGIMGRIDRKARTWLAEILYGLITGNYRRVAEIHFEAQYVPAHHNVEEFATALRAAGEPIRGLPVKDISIGQMLDSLFTITRDFDMPTQPHLLLLQKTMVMEEGVAHTLDPDINMWETAEPFLREWVRGELGPEAAIADRLIEDLRTFARIPELIRRIDHYYPPPGAAPLGPPLPAIVVQPRRFGRYLLTALISAAAGAGAMLLLH